MNSDSNKLLRHKAHYSSAQLNTTTIVCELPFKNCVAYFADCHRKSLKSYCFSFAMREKMSGTQEKIALLLKSVPLVVNYFFKKFNIRKGESQVIT